MRIGLISDVHANLPALQATLARLATTGVDQVVCAGDLVGYGPHPDACVDLLRREGVPCVAGNHDLMAVEELSTDRCVDVARRSQEWTRATISKDTVDHLVGLPAEHPVGPLLVTHASIGDPQYHVYTEVRARRQLAELRRRGEHRILVVGHTHKPWLFSETGGTVRRRLRGPTPLPDDLVLLNPGSVGQSRQFERVPRARCAIIDPDAGTVRFLAVDYDWSRTRRDLEAIGLERTAMHSRPKALGAYRRVRRVVEDRTGLRLPRRADLTGSRRAG